MLQSMKQTQNGAISVNATITVVAILLVIIGVVYFATDNSNDVMMEDKQMEKDVMVEDENMEKDTMMEGEEMMMSGYEGEILAGSSAPLLDFKKADYDEALNSSKLVALYFYANWCPTCKAEIKDALLPGFNELSTDNVIGFRVNYNDNDTDEYEKALAQEFGVAYQHTKVFVKNGERVLKSPETWDKDRYLSEIESQI